MIEELKPAILITFAFTLLTGILYPLAVTGVAQAVFPAGANGSLVLRDGRVVGSELIGQNFTQPQYFHPRPSAAGMNGYDASASGGSNLGPTNPALADRLTRDAAQWRKDNPGYQGPIPADAITASASGLDPEISPENAMAQATRVSAARQVSLDEVKSLVGLATSGRDLRVLGEPRVNVLRLNLLLDRSFPKR